LNLALIINAFRDLIGPDWNPLKIHFQQSAITGIESLLTDGHKTRIYTQQPYTAVTFSTELLAKPPTHRERPADRNQDGPQRGTNLSIKIDHLLNSNRQEQIPNLEHLADIAGMSARTLQRKLVDEGTTFSTIIDQWRFKKAVELLADPKVLVKDIYRKVGYSDVSNFERAFRRWTHTTPGKYRDSLPLSWIEYETLINPFATLKAVDYGDTGLNPYSNSQSLEEIRRKTREIAETGAIPFAVGGDHSVPNGTFRGIVDVYGRKNVAFLHFDVHLDRGTGKFGAFYHSGTFMTLAVKEGLLKGSDVIQFGMATPVFGEDLWEGVLKEGGKVYHLHEILRDGVDATFDKIYEDLAHIDLVYVSFDVDTFDMAYAPGTGSSSPTGMIPRELFPKLREFAATKTIVGFDIVEFNPFYDNKGQQTARLVRRIMFQFLTGIAMKKEGMDPKYVHPMISGKP